MKRRQFLAASGVAAGGMVGVAGCLGSATSAPPRESAVFENIHMADGALLIEFESQPVVQSRAQLDTNGALAEPAGGVASLFPVGIASAQATGRGQGGAEDAPEGRNGRPKWRAGGHEEWWERNEDKVNEYDATVVKAAIGYFGTEEQYKENPPGPTPLDWEREFNDPDESVGWQTDYEAGWYRVGARLEAANADHTFSWEYVDLELVPETETDGSGNTTAAAANTTDSEGADEGPPLEVGTQWKVSAGL